MRVAPASMNARALQRGVNSNLQIDPLTPARKIGVEQADNIRTAIDQLQNERFDSKA